MPVLTGKTRTGPSTPLIVESKRGGPHPVSCGALAGHLWDFDCRDHAGRKWLRRVAVLADHRYVYPVFFDRALDTPPGLGDVLEELLASIEPVPSEDRAGPDLGAKVLDSWA